MCLFDVFYVALIVMVVCTGISLLLCCFFFVFFFFQAEDGIRDLVRSRGLGDVYKRQIVFGHLRNHEVNNYRGFKGFW